VPESILRYVSTFVMKVNGNPIPASYKQRIVELTVDEKENHATEISYRVIFIETSGSVDDPVVKEKDAVTIRFGWVGQLSRMHKCICIGIDGPQMEASGVSWTVRLRDHLTKLSHKKSQRVIKGKSIASVVLDIALGNGLVPYLPTTQGIMSAVSRLNVASVTQALRSVVNETQSHESDHQVLRRLSHRVDHHLRVDGDKLILEKPDYAKGPIRDYVWRGGARGELFSFKPASHVQGKHAGPSTETKALGFDYDKKKVVTAKANEDTEAGRAVLAKGHFHVDRADGAETAAPTPPTPLKEGGSSSTVAGTSGRWSDDTTGKIWAHPTGDKQELKDRVQSTRSHGESSQIQATATVYGNPLVEKNQVYRFVGVGRKNSGNYRTLSVKHVISQSGFTTEMGLHRQGHHSASKRKSEVGKGNPNRGKPSVHRAPKVVVDIATGQERVYQ
jgi:phage protein D